MSTIAFLKDTDIFMSSLLIRTVFFYDISNQPNIRGLLLYNYHCINVLHERN